MDELAYLVNRKNSIRYCEECHERMSYTSVHGIYMCKKCGHQEKDLYGRMKSLLEDNPALSKWQLSGLLNVPLRDINQFIRSDGVLENPNPDQP